jgi:hypothetical protein
MLSGVIPAAERAMRVKGPLAARLFASAEVATGSAMRAPSSRNLISPQAQPLE